MRITSISITNKYILLLLSFIILNTSISFSNEKSNEILKTKIKLNNNLFPDSYSELDDEITLQNLETEGVDKIISEARKKFYQGVDFKKKRDTISAILYFDKSLSQLNTLISVPDIDQNDKFYDLTQQIFEEYESLVNNLDDFDENTPLFVIRDKFFKDLEKTNIPLTTGLEIKDKKLTSSSKIIDVLTQPNKLRIPMDQNEFVLKNIQYLTQTKARKFFTKWLERSTRYLPILKQIAKEEGMPEEIIYLSMIESGLDPNAVSKAGAVGLWQFMRPTGLDYSLNTSGSKWIDERRDPIKATKASMKYLNDLYNMFGDWHLALASYNCGQGRVAKAIKRSNKKNPNYWDIRDILPLETRFYVSHYIATATIAMDPQFYGFSFDSLNFQSLYEYDTFELKEPINLDAIAKCLNTDINLVKAYNPELIKQSTPLDIPSYKLKIPKGAFNDFAGKFSILTDEEKRPWITYEVGKRETISSIASKFKISEEDIISVNEFSNSRAKLKRGAELRLPVTVEQYNLAMNTQSINSEYPLDGSSDVFHIVKKGESLFSISRKYGISLIELKTLNNYEEKKETVTLGQQLIIAHKSDISNSIFKNVKSVPNPNNISEDNKLTHKVKKGETLARIADLYGVTINDLKITNKLKSNKVNAGVELIVNSENLADDNKSSKKLNINKLSTKSSNVVHKVQSGETIGIIAAKYGVTENEIKSMNRDVIEGNTIFSGTKLKIASDDNKGSAESISSKVNKLPNYYTIRNGETLTSISRKFGISINNILNKNKSLEENKIIIGQKIRLQ